jgi:hypothetical protein
VEAKMTKKINNDDQNKNLNFPKSVMTGAAGQFAKIYGEHLESPEQFFFMAYLTFFGLSVSDHFSLHSHRKPTPRLYTILLGESADTRKSSAMEETADHFLRYFKSNNGFAICRGAASGEGIGNLLKSSKKILLYYDELKVFVSKCNIKNSTLLMAANTLFEATRFENRTAKDPIIIDQAHCALLAASTVDTYARLFNSQFLDIGFNNRLFLVPGESSKCIPVPKPIRQGNIIKLYDALDDRIRLIERNPQIDIEKVASEKWAEFYQELKNRKSPYTKRLDTYGLRLMPLLAVNDMKNIVDLETVNKVIKLIEWQYHIRQIYDPIDAEGKVATMEEKIRRAFNQQPEWEYRDLQRKVNYSRDGLWVWESAIKNLKNNEEIKKDRWDKVFCRI